MILNSSETSGPLSKGRILKMCTLEVKRGVRSNPLEPPLPTGLHDHNRTQDSYIEPHFPDFVTCSIKMCMIALSVPILTPDSAFLLNF